MARPTIVRADTLDLQDQENPSAADRSKHPNQSGVAPHQASQLHHVVEERQSEEQSLADAWNIAGSLTDEPGAIEQAQANAEHEHVTNGTQQDGEEGGEGGESEAEGDDDMMDRISSSPSIDDEDIDFEFVYALHTFVATVEGQANATKGDTMVLLDDSNSYWWLVRVVKDSSIGYLPAEHIETPTERLARLNKHRNIDLSATMLSDNSEKTRNPLKKAMRRRNAKTVQFAAPTYVEASDYDYSTEDDEQGMIDPYGGAGAPTEEPQQNGHVEEPDDEDVKPEEDDETQVGTATNRGSFDREQAATLAASIDEPQLSPKLVDKTEAAPLKSRKGTARNADSFLKDDSIETRKITLTPGLLREDNMSIKSASSESMRNNSTENLVKTTSPPEQQSKKEIKEKKKEKAKGGMLSGLFKSKKKDKKIKEDAGAESDMEKPSLEVKRDSPRASPVPSGKTSPVERPVAAQTTTDPRYMAQAKQPTGRSKLQKQPPPQTSSPVQERNKEPGGAFVAELPGDEVAHEMATGYEGQVSEPQQQLQQPQPQQIDMERTQQPETEKEKEGPLSPIKNILTSSDKDAKPKKAKRSKQRVELDDFDSPEDEDGPNPFREQEERQRGSQDEGGRDRLSESPVEIMPGTFMHGTEIVHIPTPGEDDQPEEANDSPESLTSSPSLIEHPAEPHEDGEREEDNNATPTAPRSLQPVPSDGGRHATLLNRNLSVDSTFSDANGQLSPHLSTPSASPQVWSDSSLRAWLDDGSEVKDMLMMIHDKSNVAPVGADHPMMAGLFVQQRQGVQKMMGDLDGLLGGYLQRKGIALG